MNWRLFDRFASVTTVVVALLGLAYMLTPLFVIFPISFSSERYLRLPVPSYSIHWYERMWNSQGYMTAFSNTILVGLGVGLAAAILGTMAALGVVRGRLRFGGTVSMMIMSPLIMPQIILAIGIFPIMAALGLVGTRAAVIMAHVAIAIPLVFTTVSASLRSYSDSMELAAMTLGANNVRTFLHVTLPMIRLGIIVGAIFAFALSFDEIIIALFLTDASSVTLPVFMWNELRYQMEPTIAAASTVAVIFSLSLLTAVALLQRAGKRFSNDMHQ
ncbi:ABC transporter permease [Mesorhizobium sp. CU2]|uniref:ABC transporter permease n=1 Tax=unclassified Mesorhizobium TaxID=325217 RepID=UPI0011270935|nr:MULTISPECIES: ABC transporter permease [unclassified Mesorhizobium]TPN81132.1 ABC transporter permease [Mesorhizobium sp. CU3]TPO17069.1 ABC transporter permease [Mesorhizobium sp. CU2]